jgi:hypothetical protein
MNSLLLRLETAHLKVIRLRPIQNRWESFQHDIALNKVVTSKEGDLVGNVEATDESAVLVSSEGARTHYRIPKDVVEGFDGHAVSLKISKNELEKYKTQMKEGFGEVK